MAVEQDLKQYTIGSHKKVDVTCDAQISPKCRKNWSSPVKDVFRYRKSNDGKDICLYCSRKMKFTGKGNPNCKYSSIDRTFFKVIDTPEKAYILGWIASDGHVEDDKIVVSIHKNDSDIIYWMYSILKGGYITHIVRIGASSMISITWSSKEMAQDVADKLRIPFGKKAYDVHMPELSKKLLAHFLRGYFDGDGTVKFPSLKNGAPQCAISTVSKYMQESLNNIWGIPNYVGEGAVYWWGTNALNFMGELYRDGDNMCLFRKYRRYRSWAVHPLMPYRRNMKMGEDIVFRYKRLRNDAVPPYKKNVSDSGFDLTILECVDKVGEVYYYDTGIAIQPDYNWYLDVVPRSSLSKLGWGLANSVGILDQDFRGSIKVPLFRLTPDAPELSLPFRAVQIIPRPIVHPEMIEVTEDSLILHIDKDKLKPGCVIGNGNNNTRMNTSKSGMPYGSWWSDTTRGDEGFGSTGK